MYISIYFYTHMRILKILMRVNIFIRRPSGDRHAYTHVHLQLLWYSVCIRHIYVTYIYIIYIYNIKYIVYTHTYINNIYIYIHKYIYIYIIHQLYSAYK